MENPGPSRTAVATATHRAAHHIFDGAPKILADPFARDLAGFSTDEEIRTALDAFAFPDPSRLRTVFTVRTGTSLTGLKQVYDPTRILTQNTRALLDLRQLHQEVILSVKCDAKESRAAVDSNKMTDWINAIRRMRATILPEYGAYANLDVGGSSQRFEPTSNQSRGAPAETQGQDQTAPAGSPTPPANK
jgi:hypothetical protein